MPRLKLKRQRLAKHSAVGRGDRKSLGAGGICRSRLAPVSYPPAGRQFSWAAAWALPSVSQQQ
jgi:hypothetical protein